MEILAAFKPVKFKLCNDESVVQRVLFIRQGCEGGKLRKASMSRTLLVIGLPYFVSTEALTEMFAPFGHVVDVRWIDLNCSKKFDEPTSSTARSAEKEVSEPIAKSADSEDPAYCKGAEIEFENESSVQELLADASNLLLVASLKPNSVCIGMKKWCDNYAKSLSDPNGLKEKAISITTAYDKQKEQEKQKMSAMKEIDEDGWTLVTKLNKKRRARGRVDPNAEKSSAVSSSDFYAFKKEEAKLQQVATLKRKYEEDKQRLAQLKASRKFKPE